MERLRINHHCFHQGSKKLPPEYKHEVVPLCFLTADVGRMRSEQHSVPFRMRPTVSDVTGPPYSPHPRFVRAHHRGCSSRT
jgi:hypothetical protein